MTNADPTKFVTRARAYADDRQIPIHHAIRWTPPYDLARQREWLSDLPEMAVIDLAIGGVIAIENP